MAIDWDKVFGTGQKGTQAQTGGMLPSNLTQQAPARPTSKIDWAAAMTAQAPQMPDVVSPTAAKRQREEKLRQELQTAAQQANWMQPTVTASAQAAALPTVQKLPGSTRLSARRAQQYADLVNNAAEEDTLNRLQAKIDNLTAQRGTEQNGFYYYDTPEGSAYLNKQLKEIEQVLRDQYGRDYELRGIQQAQDALDDLNHNQTRELGRMQESLPMLQQYAEIYDRPDFEKNSRYRTTKDPNAGAPEHERLTNYLYNTGYGDILYDYINGDPGAVEIQRFNDAALGLREAGLDKSFLEQMSENEKKTFNYLYATQGADSAYEYIRQIQGNLTYRNRLEQEAEWRRAAQEHPAAASALSALMSPARGASYVGQLADYLGDGKIDQNAGYNRFTQIPGTIRGQVSEDIREKGGKLWGPVGSFLYNSGMSMADFLLNTGITGGNEGLTLALMGTGAAADAVVSAKDRGLTDDQAFALGTIAGAAEIITEKVSIETLLDASSLSASRAGYFLKNLLAEGSEEVGSDFINLFADVLIAKDQSQWRQAISEKERNGASEREAFWQAFGEQAADMGLDFLGGAISGAAMAGGAIGIGTATDVRQSQSAQTAPFEAYQNILNQERNAQTAPAATTEEANTNGSEPAEPTVPAAAAVAEPETVQPVTEPAERAEPVPAETVPASAEPVAAAERADVVPGGGQERGAAPADTGGAGAVDRAGTTVTPTIQQRYDTARERYSRWQQSGGTLTSTKALGLQDGTDTQNVMVFDDPATWDDEMKTVSRTWEAVASRVKEMYGADFNIRFVGGLTEVEIGGVTKQIVGVVDESGVTLNCTSGQYGLTQTSEHELFHTLCSMYPQLEGMVFSSLADSGAWEQMAPVLEQLDAMYKALGYENSGDMAIEETMADIFSGINRFEEHDLSSLRDKAMQIVDEQTRTMAPAENWQPGARDRNPEGGPMYLRRVSQNMEADENQLTLPGFSDETQAAPAARAQETAQQDRQAKRNSSSIAARVEQFMDEDTPRKYRDRYAKAIGKAREALRGIIPADTAQARGMQTDALLNLAETYYLNTFLPEQEIESALQQIGAEGEQADAARKVFNAMVDNLPAKLDMESDTIAARREKAEARVEKELDEAWKAAYEGQRNASIEQRVTEAARVARNEAQTPARMEAFEAAREAIRSKTMEEVQKEAESGGLAQPPNYAENEKVQRSRKKRDFIGDLWYQALRANANLQAQNTRQERADTAAAAASNAAAREAAEAAEPRINEAQGITREQLISWGNRLPESVLERVNNEWGGKIPSDLYQMMNQVAKDMPRRQNNYTTTRNLDEIGVNPAGSLANYWGVDSLIANAKAARSIARDIRKLENGMAYSEEEKVFARELANGTFTADSVPAGVSLSKVQELADYYTMEKMLENDQLAQQRQRLNAEYDAETLRTMYGVSLRPNRKNLALNLEQTSLVFENEAQNIKDGRRMAEVYADPIRENNARAKRWYNDMMNAVREYDDGKGGKRELTEREMELSHRVIESSAVHAFMENNLGNDLKQAVTDAAYAIRDGHSSEEAAQAYGVPLNLEGLACRLAEAIDTQELMNQTDADSRRVIAEAVERYRAQYDKLYKAINDFLVAHGYEPIGFVQGYAPNMQPKEATGVFGKVLTALGAKQDVKNLPESISGQTWMRKPYKRWDPHFMHRGFGATEYNIAKGYQEYCTYLADIFFHTDDIMRLRSLSRYVKNFSDETSEEALQMGYQVLNMPTETQRRFLEDRGVLKASDKASPERIRQKLGEYLDAEEQQDPNDPYRGARKKEGTHTAFTTWLDGTANTLAHKQSFYDRGAEEDFGRTSLNLGNWINTTFKRSKTAGNLSSVLNNFSQLFLSIPEFGLRNTIRAAGQTINQMLDDRATSELRALQRGSSDQSFKQAIDDLITDQVGKENFINESNYLYGKKFGKQDLYVTKGGKIIDALYKPTQAADFFMSSVVVRGAYLDAVKQGMNHDDAIKYADKIGEKIMGSRDTGVQPQYFERKSFFPKLLSTFQVEPLQSFNYVVQDKLINGIKEIKEIEDEHGKKAARAALAGFMVQMLITSFLMNRIGEELYGGTPGQFDFLGWALKYYATGKGVSTNDLLKAMAGLKDVDFNDEFDAWNAASETGYDIMSDMPFARNVAGLLGKGDQTLAVPQVIGKLGDAFKSLKNNGLTLDTLEDFLVAGAEIMPAGSQISKTARGLRIMGEGGKYLHAGTEKEQLKYPVEDSWANWIKAAMFGPYALEESQSYYAKAQDKRTSLSRSATADYRDLTDAGMDRTDAYRLIKERNRINNLDKDEDNPKTDAEIAQMKLDALDRLNLPEEAQSAAYGVMMGTKMQDKMTAAGLDAGPALEFQQAVDLAEIENGDETLANTDLWRFAVSTYSDPAVQIAALSGLMTDAQAEKLAVTTLYATPAAYVDFHAAYSAKYEGGFSQDNVEAVLDAMDIPNDAKAAIWQSCNKSWAAKNNPYNVSVSEQVRSLLNPGSTEQQKGA